MQVLITGKIISFSSMQGMGRYQGIGRCITSPPALAQLLLLCAILIAPVLADDIPNTTLLQSRSDLAAHGSLDQEGGDILPFLLTLLQDLGVDISYGDEGDTIFAMVDRSLTQIIEDLSSGQIEGFTQIPLINETLRFAGIEPAEIVISPDETPGRMAAVDAYASRYPSEE